MRTDWDGEVRVRPGVVPGMPTVVVVRQKTFAHSAIFCKQRMADSLGELVHHAMDEGRLPRRNGVTPHVNVTTTLEGLKNEPGVPAADLELSLPISTRTVERIACDSTISRVLLADSMVIDVGRATRGVSADATGIASARSWLPLAEM